MLTPEADALQRQMAHLARECARVVSAARRIYPHRQFDASALMQWESDHGGVVVRDVNGDGMWVPQAEADKED